MFLPAPGVSELVAGIRCLPLGRRRGLLEIWLDNVIGELFVGRVLPFDLGAAEVCGGLVGESKRAGRPTGLVDAQIAAIAISRGMTVATRNTRHFEPLGAASVNPFDGA